MLGDVMRLDSTNWANWYWLMGWACGSTFSLKSTRRMMPPKIAIQAIQVRGGTLNSPFLEFFSSSLFLLSSAILYLVAPKLPSIPQCRNRLNNYELSPLPRPMQAANGFFCKLKSFRQAEA